MISNINFIQEYRLEGETGYTSSDVINMGNNEFLLLLDDNSGSTYNIKTNGLTINRPTLENTPVYLKSFILNDSTSGATTGTTSGSSLFEYYISKYDSFDHSTIDSILLGILPFAYLFEHDNVIEIDDVISYETIDRIIMYGDYPKGVFNFEIALIDIDGFVNKQIFKIIVN
jgi:hypothetical protein